MAIELAKGVRFFFFSFSKLFIFSSTSLLSLFFSAILTFFFSFFFTEVSIVHTTCPTFTISPSSTRILITPLSSAGSSKVALSESTSAID